MADRIGKIEAKAGIKKSKGSDAMSHTDWDQDRGRGRGRGRGLARRKPGGLRSLSGR